MTELRNRQSWTGVPPQPVISLESPYQETRDVDIASITGVGSSAVGRAALAWDISVALEKPVLAIVPGYGFADVVMRLVRLRSA